MCHVKSGWIKRLTSSCGWVSLYMNLDTCSAELLVGSSDTTSHSIIITTIVAQLVCKETLHTIAMGFSYLPVIFLPECVPGSLLKIHCIAKKAAVGNSGSFRLAVAEKSCSFCLFLHSSFLICVYLNFLFPILKLKLIHYFDCWVTNLLVFHINYWDYYYSRRR